MIRLQKEPEEGLRFVSQLKYFWWYIANIGLLPPRGLQRQSFRGKKQREYFSFSPKRLASRCSPDCGSLAGWNNFVKSVQSWPWNKCGRVPLPKTLNVFAVVYYNHGNWSKINHKDRMVMFFTPFHEGSTGISKNLKCISHIWVAWNHKCPKYNWKPTSKRPKMGPEAKYDCCKDK